MHADAVFRNGHFQWATFFDPDPQDWKRFESAGANSGSEDDDWITLEPDYKQ